MNCKGNKEGKPLLKSVPLFDVGKGVLFSNDKCLGIFYNFLYFYNAKLFLHKIKFLGTGKTTTKVEKICPLNRIRKHNLKVDRYLDAKHTKISLSMAVLIKVIRCNQIATINRRFPLVLVFTGEKLVIFYQLANDKAVSLLMSTLPGTIPIKISG